jgi:putative ABC transport system permease protein
MFQNYLKVAFRNLLQHKFYSLINIAGLAVGMTVCILLMLSVQDELSYDNFHPNLDNLFRVVQAENTVTPAALGPTLKRDYPEVINFARVLWREWKLEAEDKGVVEIGACADPSFLDMFGFQYIAGDPATALFGPKSVVITESLKRKLFGDQNAIGKSITLRSHHQSTITGVIADLPHNTFLPDMSWIIPFNNIQKWWGWDLEDWDSSNYRTFVTLHNGVRYREFGQRIAGIASIYDPGNTTMVHLQPVRKIHLYGLKGEGPIRYVYIFSAVALCILLIACVNFMNLATARSAKRAKEVGMRKVVGANRGNLIKQFLSESILLSIFAMLMAVALVELLLPVFNGLTQKHLSINYAGNWMYFVGLVGIALFTGLVSGSYPALFLSSFNPVNALKYSSSTTVSAATLRKILVVSQFSLSILLIAGTIVVHKQLNYMRNKDLGYDKDYLVCMTWRTDLIKNWQTIAQKLQENPRIKAITLTNTLLDESESSTDDWTWQGKSDESKPKIRDGIAHGQMDNCRRPNRRNHWSSEGFSFQVSPSQNPASGIDDSA